MTEKEIYLIKNNIKQQLADRNTAPLFIAGAPGSAKSSTIQLIATELSMQLVDVSAPTLSIEVLTGC